VDSAIQGTDDWIVSSWGEGRDDDNIQLRSSVESEQQIVDATPEDNLEDVVNALIEAESFESGYFYVSNAVGDGTISTRPVTRGGSEINPSADLYVNGEFDAPNTEGIFNSDRTYHFKSGGISEND
jgi:hypothetical protein